MYRNQYSFCPDSDHWILQIEFWVLILLTYWCSFQILQERIWFSLGRYKGQLLFMQHDESYTVFDRWHIDLQVRSLRSIFLHQREWRQLPEGSETRRGCLSRAKQNSPSSFAVSFSGARATCVARPDPWRYSCIAFSFSGARATFVARPDPWQYSCIWWEKSNLWSTGCQAPNTFNLLCSIFFLFVMSSYRFNHISMHYWYNLPCRLGTVLNVISCYLFILSTCMSFYHILL